MCVFLITVFFHVCRARILSDSGITHVEEYMGQDHEMLRRAAVQCIANLMLSDEVCISQIQLRFQFCIFLKNLKIYFSIL